MMLVSYSVLIPINPLGHLAVLFLTYYIYIDLKEVFYFCISKIYHSLKVLCMLSSVDMFFSSKSVWQNCNSCVFLPRERKFVIECFFIIFSSMTCFFCYQADNPTSMQTPKDNVDWCPN